MSLYDVLEKKFVVRAPGQKSAIFGGFTSQRDGRVLRPRLVEKGGKWCFYNKKKEGEQGHVPHVPLDDFVKRYREKSIQDVAAYYDDGKPSMITLSNMICDPGFDEILRDLSLVPG